MCRLDVVDMEKVDGGSVTKLADVDAGWWLLVMCLTLRLAVGGYFHRGSLQLFHE